MATPQDKKRLSYAKDRRNTFGENSKASRKGIPLAKARSIRSERHEQDHQLTLAVSAQDEDELVAVEMAVRSSKPRQWKKSPDQPLQEVLTRKARHKDAT